MLGDSMRRRLGGSRGERKSRDGGVRRPWWAPRIWWLWLCAIAIPLGGGYLIATQILFPKPPVMSLGTAVPQLVGRDVSDARRELMVAGLSAPVTIGLPNAEVPHGVVTAQSPLAGQQAHAGTVVRVAISTGVPSVAVPDVRGFALQRATTLLRGLGFEVTDTLEESDLPTGRVSGVEPDPGTTLQLPDTVRLYVSTGPPPDTMALDTITIRSDTILRTASRWPAAAGAPIFARGGTLRRTEGDGG